MKFGAKTKKIIYSKGFFKKSQSNTTSAELPSSF